MLAMYGVLARLGSMPTPDQIYEQGGILADRTYLECARSAKQAYLNIVRNTTCEKLRSQAFDEYNTTMLAAMEQSRIQRVAAVSQAVDALRAAGSGACKPT